MGARVRFDRRRPAALHGRDEQHPDLRRRRVQRPRGAGLPVRHHESDSHHARWLGARARHGRGARLRHDMHDASDRLPDADHAERHRRSRLALRQVARNLLDRPGVRVQRRLRDGRRGGVRRSSRTRTHDGRHDNDDETRHDSRDDPRHHRYRRACVPPKASEGRRATHRRPASRRRDARGRPPGIRDAPAPAQRPDGRHDALEPAHGTDAREAPCPQRR